MAPHWQTWNSGLTAPQYQNINRFFQTPSGACYCGYINIQNTSTGATFLARAPSLGAAWTVLYDQTNLSPINAHDWGVSGLGVNPLLADTVAAIIQLGSDEVPRFYLGSGGVFTGGLAIASTYFSTWSVSYGLGKWMVASFGNQSNGKVRILPADGSSVTVASTPTYVDRPHVRASSTGTTFHQTAVSSGYDIVIGTNNFTSYTPLNIGNSLAFDDRFGGPGYFACDAAGRYMMSRGSGGKQRSSDGGFTWGGIPNLPAGNWWFDYAGPGDGGLARFVAAGGSSIRYSPDFGDTWLNKEGNLTSLVPLPDIDMIKVLVY
jgi:hypothetical protein